MTKWILIIIIKSGVYAASASVDHIEFSSKEACQYAAAQVAATAKRNDDATKVLCVPEDA